MKTFEELKQELLSRVENVGPLFWGIAVEQIKSAVVDCKTRSKLLNVIKANWPWNIVCCAKFIDAAFLEENFTGEELQAVGIYTSGEHETNKSCIVCGTATVEVFDSEIVHAWDGVPMWPRDSVAVEAYGNARVRAYNNVKVEAHNNAEVHAHDSTKVNAYDDVTVIAEDSVLVEAHGSAQVTASDIATVRARDNAQVYAHDRVEVEAYGSARVEAYGSATVKAFHCAKVIAFNSARVEAYGSATVEAIHTAKVIAHESAKVGAYGESYVEDYTGRNSWSQDYSIVKDCNNHKIYVKKGNFEIVEVD